MKKGFTLVELLAVIVILAIISLIAVPIILNIVNDSRESANETSLELYRTAIINSIAKHKLAHPTDSLIGNGTTSNNGKTLIIGDKELIIEYDTAKIECDEVQITEKGIVNLSNCRVNDSSNTYSTKVSYESGLFIIAKAI